MGGGGGESSDSDNELTARQKNRFAKKFIPGAKGKTFEVQTPSGSEGESESEGGESVRFI
jgi:hypothetical protein